MCHKENERNLFGIGQVIFGTLPETKSSPLKIGLPKRKVVSQPPFFRGYVSFRECNCQMVQKAIPENMYEIHPSDFCLQSKSCLLFRGEVVCVTNTLSLGWPSQCAVVVLGLMILRNCGIIWPNDAMSLAKSNLTKRCFYQRLTDRNPLKSSC